MASKSLMKKLKQNPLNIQKEINAKQQALNESQDQEHQKALAKCIPIAREVLRIIHEDQLEIGDISADSVRPEKYVEASTKIRQLMIELDLTWIDRHFVFQLALQPVDKLKDIVLSDLAKSYEAGMTVLLGVESFTTMTMGDMQKAFVARFNEVNAMKAQAQPGDMAVLPVE